MPDTFTLVDMDRFDELLGSAGYRPHLTFGTPRARGDSWMIPVSWSLPTDAQMRAAAKRILEEKRQSSR